jgi:malate dehydrogenase (quinone)
VRKWLFLKDARKIVPSLKLRDLKFAHNVGGIRPQLIDKDHQKLLMGEAKIDTGIGAIFNMTPSPGGTSCLENAEIDLRIIVEHLGASIDEAAFKQDLLGEDHKHTDSDFTGRVLSGDDAA